MKKLLMILFISFLLVACTPKKETADLLGSDGLSITIGRTPSELYVGQGLQIPVELENVGTATVKNAVLAVDGYTQDVIKFTSPTRIEGINLEGKSQFVSRGERTTKFFTIGSIVLPNNQDRKETFNILACYQYQTQASPVVCINPQLALGLAEVPSGCTFVDAQISPSQGAPVAVTKVETYYVADKQEVEFRIFIKDVSGKGVLVNSLAYAKRCLSPDPLTKDDFDSISMEAYLGGQKLECSVPGKTESTDTFTLSPVDTADSIRCHASYDTREQAYTSILSVYLSYGYIQGKEFSITLKNPLSK
ncbi:MAG TPA: hypothetical protein VKE88_03085 [Candidatus Nanoarchaeia archaeon]|nr:hypothetical protein [Candidatus Nanoarchaeia archaeon]